MAHANHQKSELINPDGSPRFTNALARETSPYLLQHAHNPVDWHPWGPDAFALARRQQKLIFLSIGYSTCYWCHVMERQVFENIAIGSLMNEKFINIKVDREERPDVDDIYMLAVQVMTGHGGWPMSVFLTPPGAGGEADHGLKPFYAGTYFPPEPMHGRPGFPQIIEALDEAWSDRRPEVIQQAEQIAATVSEHLGRLDPAGTLDIDLISTAANRLLRTYDDQNGGFGDAPKFPTPSNLLFLLEVYRNRSNLDLWNALANTLDRMARGGLYDQIGGGFHRYSTDAKWLVPHFEKMLYDNGQLVEVYLTAQSIKPDEAEPTLYPRIIRQTCDYILREMTDATGAFWSAQDAEVDALEGGNYLWRLAEFTQVIGDEKLAKLAARMYGLDQGTNFQDPHHPEQPAGNVLHLPVRLNELAAEQGISLADLLETKRRIDNLLLTTRDRRKQPGTDDKVLVSWNGMMIAALARAGNELGEAKYTQAAARAAQAILDRMRDGEGGLLRSMRKGSARIPAFLDDYAFFIHGLIELHRASGEARWIETARSLVEQATRRFAAATGGYFDTLAGQADLFVRTRSTYDGAIPSGNSQMIHNLIDLYEQTRQSELLDRAIVDLESFADAMRRNGQGMARMQQALLRVMTLAPTKFSAAVMQPTQESNKRRVVSLEVEGERVALGRVGATGRVTLTLRIGPDYHLNANVPGQDDLIPTKLELRDAPGVELTVDYPQGVTRRYPFADRDVIVYAGDVRIIATLTRREAAASLSGRKPALVLSYQVCTEMSCLEPRTVEVPLKIE